MRRDLSSRVEKMYAYQFKDKKLSEVESHAYEPIVSAVETWFSEFGLEDAFFTSGPPNQFRLPEDYNYDGSYVSNYNGHRLLIADTERPSKTWFPEDTYIIIASEEGELIKHVPFFNNLYEVEPLKLVDEVDSDLG